MSIQTEYKDKIDDAYAGLVVESFSAPRIISRTAKSNKLTSGFNQDYIVPGKCIMPAGLAADRPVKSEIVNSAVTATPLLQGISTLIHTDKAANNTGDTHITDGSEFGVLEDGVIWMYCEDAVNYYDPLLMVIQATTVNATNQAKVGNVAKAAIAGVDVSSPVPLRSLSETTAAGLIKVRVFPLIPIDA